MPPQLPARMRLCSTPTPLEPADRLTEAWRGPRIWFKRDDLTGFGVSGNKIRKLEFHLAAAKESGADTVITCGAVQSNHSRATALACARVGMRAVLLLRNSSTMPPALTGNFLLDYLAGADIRFITPEQWDSRDELMADEAKRQASEGHVSWIVPEGASDVLGMWGFVLALREVADQAAAITGRPPILWHAASSGGTTAGIGWGADRLGLSLPIVACSIGDPATAIEAKVNEIWAAAVAEVGGESPRMTIEYNEAHIGSGYGLVTDDELAIQREATSLTGLVFDPTYTGKALVGLYREIQAGRYGPDDNVVFWHTGGGFAVFAHDFSQIAAAEDPAVHTA